MRRFPPHFCPILIAVTLAAPPLPLTAAVAPKWCGEKLTAETNIPVKLSGVLTSEIHWGGPGFGEDPNTDIKYTAYILNLDYATPVEINQAPYEPPRTVVARKVNLRLDYKDTTDLAQYLHRHVLAVGPLGERYTAYDLTPVFMFGVQQIRPAGKVGCDGREVSVKAGK